MYLPLHERAAAELFIHALSFALANCTGRTGILLTVNQSYYSFNFIPTTMNTSWSQPTLNLKNMISGIGSKAHKSKMSFLKLLCVCEPILNIQAHLLNLIQSANILMQNLVLCALLPLPTFSSHLWICTNCNTILAGAPNVTVTE